MDPKPALYIFKLHCIQLGKQKQVKIRGNKKRMLQSTVSFEPLDYNDKHHAKDLDCTDNET